MANKLEAVIKQTLEKKIGEQVWKILKDHIEEDVYNAYQPGGRWSWGASYPYGSEYNGYQRRRSGGLLNESDKYINVMHAAGSDRWLLRVSTTATPSESVLGHSWSHHVGGFLALLEKGDLGFWSRTMDKYNQTDVTHPFPRPVITNAQQEADSNKARYQEELYKAINKAKPKQKK